MESVGRTTSLPYGKKIAYGICRFGTSIFMNITTLAIFWIYTNHFLLDPIKTGIGSAIGKVAIALSSFIFGYISDTMSTTKIGRRKFFMWIGAPLMALSFIMLFIPHFFIPIGRIGIVLFWLYFWNLMFNTFYGFTISPYQSLMTEITVEGERLVVSGIQNTTNIIANLVGAGFAFFIAGYFEEVGGIDNSSPLALIVPIVVFGIIEVIFFLPALLTIKEPKIKVKKRNVLNEIRIAIKNKNYLTWVFGQGVFSISIATVSALILDFATDIIGLKTINQFLIFGAAIFVTIIASFFFWGKVSRIIGKKWSLILSFLLLLIVLPFSLVLANIQTKHIELLGYLYAFLAGFGLSPSYLFPYAIIADIADSDYRKTGIDRSGIYYGFNMIVLNFFQAFGFLFTGLVRNLENKGLQWLGVIAAAFFLLAIPIFYKADFDPFIDLSDLPGHEFNNRYEELKEQSIKAKN